MSLNQPTNDMQAKGAPMLVIFVAIGILVTLAVFVTAAMLGFSVLSSLLLTLLLASPLTFVGMLVVNYALRHRRPDLDSEAAQTFVD